MPHWEYEVNVGDVFHNRDMSFTEKRDEIVKRVKASQWYADYGQDSDSPEYTGLYDVVEGLSESATVVVFDTWWHELYDYADEQRAWVITWP